MWNKAWISGYGTYRKAYESLEVTTVAYTRALKGKGIVMGTGTWVCGVSQRE